ncbi:hypothetical protein GCM10010912_36940 [Paenibacillus albidus]|uniref:Carboxymuconolactone decarboxylase-like domain-containing protein n=2 Tax=Paenibacillus albidus TaxID=2041023 RepID=A0A917CJC9_9BACL|nr:hypothetical protein GCM10010912_36940 [Paenibacillus albidus]
MNSGIPFHVKSARSHGATREEVKSAVLVGLREEGLAVTEAFAIAMRSYDDK